MKKIKRLFASIQQVWYVKYIIVIVLGVLFVGVLDENSIWAHMRNKQRISELQEEIDQYNALHQRNQKQIRHLQHDPKAMEKIARERYFMKADDEDIFVLSDDSDNPVSQSNTSNHESVE